MFKSNRPFYRLNHNITALQVRLIDEDGKQIGIVSREEALRKAQDVDVDLVEIAPRANPPVCRLIDYKKFQYLQARKEREEKKKIKEVGFKEVRMGPFVAQHDFEVRLGKIKEFIEGGNRVKVTVHFAGRQITHPEFGHALLKRITEELNNLALVEREGRFEGKNLIMVLGRIKGRKKEEKNAESQNPQSSSQAV